MREARYRDLYTHGSLSAGGLTVCTWEARQCGRPGAKYTVRCLKAGPCRRPYSIHLGSPTEREAHYQDLYTHGSRSVPEALLCVYGKPDRAGGPVTNTLCDVWQPVYAGGHTVCIWEARQSGRPDDKYTVKYMEAGPCRRPYNI